MMFWDGYFSVSKGQGVKTQYGLPEHLFSTKPVVIFQASSNLSPLF